MDKKEYKIHIIGAGISGLIAAQVLENHGYFPIIIESSDRVGGRVKTDVVNDYQLDRGFQVLLTAYPAAKKYLNYEALELQNFLPGATIFKNGKQSTLGDPLRSPSLLLPTLFSGIGTVADKFKILKLNVQLKKVTVTEVFEKPETTTHQYLQEYGFSDDVIANFFMPFFSGIFLEPHLETSSRMFEFVYKMFGEGDAALPKSGIEAIPLQLKNNLKKTTFLFNTKVSSVQENTIILEDSTTLHSDYTIIATEANQMIPNLKNQELEWKSCETLYFETSSRKIDKPIIGLLSNENALVNNIFYHNSIGTTTKGKNELLSVTVVKKHGLTDVELQNRVTTELESHCGISDVKFLKQYSISKALPKLTDLQYVMSPSETRLTNSIFLAGDVQLNSSLNAAILSGERAAVGVVDALINNL